MKPAFAARPLRRGKRVMILATLAVAVPSLAHAQYAAPSFSDRAVGERYHVELGASFWSPTPFGIISSEQFGLTGTDINLVTDLGFAVTRFRDLDVVLRPAKKHRFRFQYTPLQYTSETTLQHAVVFNGQTFGVVLPIHAQLGWRVWRVGYEYDFLYKKYGFVGVVLEARYTELTASLQSPLTTEYNLAKAPLPAIGFIGRGYILPSVSVTAEMTGLKTPNSLKRYAADYTDFNIYGTVNVTNNAGLQAGWRRMSNLLKIEHDSASVSFKGMWWGAAVRF